MLGKFIEKTAKAKPGYAAFNSNTRTFDVDS